MKNNTNKTIAHIRTVLLMLGCAIAGLTIAGMLYPREAYAESNDPVTYKAWDNATESLADTVCEDYTVITDSDGVYNADADETEELWTTGTYVVNADATISVCVSVSGTVNIILCDGCKLTASKGITVCEYNTLNIYAQSAGTGTLEAFAEKKQAGIGGDGTNKNRNSCGAVNIHGGIINSQGGGYGAGIGGCKYQRYSNSDEEGSNGGDITIYGGDITAAGGTDGAGIGGGGVGEWIEFWTTGNGGNVTINGGKVKAVGKNGGAGIGGGSFGDGGIVTINDGIVEAYSNNGGAGIGGGSDNSGTRGDGAEVPINGGTVTAIGTAGGAGIGGGGYGKGGNVTINGGKVTATGGEFTNSSGTVRAMGIGKGAWSAYSDGNLIVDTDLIVYSNDEPITDDNKSSIEDKIQGTGDLVDITRKQYMMVEPGMLHAHNFVYAAGGATITATCIEGCLNSYDTNGITLTLRGPENLVYDGNTKAATISGYPETTIANLAEAPTLIRYYLSDNAGSTVPAGDALTGAPSYAGNYVAQMVWGGQTASLAFTITKVTPAINTKPVASDITYGQSLAESSLSRGEASVPGIFEWKNSTTVPAVADSANTEYEVVFIPDDSFNYEGVTCKVTLTVNKAAATISSDPTAKTLIINGSAQELINVGTASGGTLQYALGTDADTAPADGWSESIPTGTEEGTYYVWYKVEGDDNHNDIEPACVTVTISGDEAVDSVINAINTLPEQPSVNDKAAVEAARAAYDALTDSQKTLIGESTLNKLTSAESSLAAAINTATSATPEPKAETPKADADSKPVEPTADSGDIIDPTLPKIKLSKPKAAKKSVTVKWKKLKKNLLKKVKGIEVAYSLKRNFKNSSSKSVGNKKAKVKIKKLLSGKKYFIRIRTYAIRSGQKYVSKWSAVKKVKVK